MTLVCRPRPNTIIEWKEGSKGSLEDRREYCKAVLGSIYSKRQWEADRTNVIHLNKALLSSGCAVYLCFFIPA